MAAQQRPLSPHLSIYRQKLTGTLSILHRATGVFIAFGAFAMVCWLLAIADGDESYRRFVELAGSVPGRLLLVASLTAFIYHLLNGIRHLLWDVGWGLELRQAYATGWSVVALTALGTAVLAWFAFGAGVAP